jgi:hypothetical protein
MCFEKLKNVIFKLKQRKKEKIYWAGCECFKDPNGIPLRLASSGIKLGAIYNYKMVFFIQK